jgi:hypothetical protein
MKPLLSSSIALLIGLTVGVFLGRRSFNEHVTNEAVQQLVESGESSDRERAARAARAIEMIQDGRSGDAVELLSRPVVDFYQRYSSSTHPDERTRDVLAMIERLAATNAVVSNAIHAATARQSAGH